MAGGYGNAFAGDLARLFAQVFREHFWALDLKILARRKNMAQEELCEDCWERVGQARLAGRQQVEFCKECYLFLMNENPVPFSCRASCHTSECQIKERHPCHQLGCERTLDSIEG